MPFIAHPFIWRKEKKGNVLFNIVLNTFMVYCVRHIVNNHSAREETCCCYYMGYSFWLAARNLLYTPYRRQNSTYNVLCNTSHGALAGTRNSSIGPRRRIDPMIYGTNSGCSMTGRKEGNVLFNDTLNTFYLRLYGVRHMVKDHSDSEKGNPLPPHRLLFPISSTGSFIGIIPKTG